MEIKKHTRWIILLLGSILWSISRLLNKIARYGYSEALNLQLREFFSAIPYLLIGLSVIWLVWLMINKIYKTDIIYMIVLLLTIFFMSKYLYNQKDIQSASMVASVVEINDEERGAVFYSDDYERTVTLSVPELVYNLLDVSEEEYLVSYEYNINTPNKGWLTLIKKMEVFEQSNF